MKNVSSSYKKYNSEKKGMKFIRFIGDMRQNIDQIIEGIECKCGCKAQFREILVLYGDKIDKLRAERQGYKQKYFKDVQTLKNQLSNLEQIFFSFQQQKSEQLQASKVQNFTTQKSQNLQKLSQKINELALRDKHSDLNKLPSSKQTFSINLLPAKQPKSPKQQTQGNLMKIVRKYNIGLEQLQNLVKEYVSEYENQFDSEQQKKLYRLGKKLQKQIWMKKVKKDIEVIVSARSKIAENDGHQSQNKLTKTKSIK